MGKYPSNNWAGCTQKNDNDLTVSNSPEFALTYPARPGKKYVVEASSTLFPTQSWVFLTTNRSEIFGVVTQAVPRGDSISAIYRVTVTSIAP